MTNHTLEHLLARATALELLGWSRPVGRCAHAIVWCDALKDQRSEICADADSSKTCSTPTKETDHDPL